MLALAALACLAVPLAASTDPALADLRAQLGPDLRDRGEPLFGEGLDQLRVFGPAEVVVSERVDDPGAPFGKLLRVRIRKPGETAYAAQIQTVGNRGAVKKGDALLIGYQVRCPEGGRETGEGVWQTYLQTAGPPWDTFASAQSAAGRGWRRLFLTAVADRDFPAGKLQITLHVASQAQVLEVAGFAALNLGPGVDVARLPRTPIVYRGREANAPWRKRAEAMIEKNRKAPLTVRVLDARGRPVPNARVRVALTEHAYVFGSFTDYEAGKTGPGALRYRAEMERLFNRMTVPIYWADWGWESPQSRAEYLRILEWCRQEGLRMKAHNLLWPSLRFSPSSLKPLMSDPARLRKEIFDRMDERIAVLKPFPFENVDVLNELKSEDEFARVVGRDLYTETFRRAQRAWPKADLVYNDYAVFEGGGLDASAQARWEREVEGLRKAGVKLDVLGWQGHFGETPTDPERVWALLDRYHKRFGLPFEITEFDVNTLDEQAQADYLRDLLTAWFAHPATVGFTVWGFWEGSMWMPNGAFLRKDYSMKPNGKVWVELTKKRWTTDATVRTARDGTATVRCFRGNVAVIVGGKRVDTVLTGKGSTVVVRL